MLDWVEDVTLIGATHYETDDNGNDVPVESETTVQAAKREIAMSEFYAAAQAGIKPEVELIVHSFEYGGQLRVLWRGTKYTVIRTYQRNADEVELYLERKIADGK